MNSLLKDSFLLTSDMAHSLYSEVKDLPKTIISADLSDIIKNIDRPYTNISEILLYGCDAVSRAFTAAGSDGKYINGAASDYEAFREFTKICPFSVGSLLHMEAHILLRRLFGITDEITPENCDNIWCHTSEFLLKNELAPRRIFEILNIESIYSCVPIHDNFSSDDDIIRPTLSADAVLEFTKRGYKRKLLLISKSSSIPITDLFSLLRAISSRFEYFKKLSANTVSLTLPEYTDFVAYDPYHADEILKKAIKKDGDITEKSEISLITGELLHRILSECAHHKMILQLHIDCADYHALKRLFERIAENLQLPKILIFSKNTADIPRLSGDFPSISTAFFTGSPSETVRAADGISSASVLGASPLAAPKIRSVTELFGYEITLRALSSYLAEKVNIVAFYSQASASRTLKNISYCNIFTYIGE